PSSPSFLTSPLTFFSSVLSSSSASRTAAPPWPPFSPPSSISSPSSLSFASATALSAASRCSAPLARSRFVPPSWALAAWSAITTRSSLSRPPSSRNLWSLLVSSAALHSSTSGLPGFSAAPKLKRFTASPRGVNPRKNGPVPDGNHPYHPRLSHPCSRGKRPFGQHRLRLPPRPPQVRRVRQETQTCSRSGSQRRSRRFPR